MEDMKHDNLISGFDMITMPQFQLSWGQLYESLSTMFLHLS